MSASQLLRILQTLPPSSDDEICGFNTDELEANTNMISRCTNPFLSDDNQVDFWNNQPELETSTFGNHEFNNNHEDDHAFRKSPDACNVHSHSLAGFQIDKHSVECTMPELVVCYKDKASDFHVKDICIDGVPDEETNSNHKDNNHEFSYSSVLVNGDDDDGDDMIESGLDNKFLKHEWLRSSTMACCSMDDELNSSMRKVTRIYGEDNSTHISYQEKLNLSTNLHDNVSSDQQVANSMISLQQDWSLTPLEFPVSSNVCKDDINRHLVQGFKDVLGKNAFVGSLPEKQDKDSQLTNIFNESKIEENVTFHFETEKTDETNPCEPLNIESTYELPLETHNVVDDDQHMAYSYKLAVKDHETRHVGDSSFSMAGVISELISSSRPMPFVGDMSTRSDSSATSTRSFAFPTLETEYTSSPVRMGKSERKRLQKHRGWRAGLICCKF